MIMATFVPIPGMCHGGWSCEHLTEQLRLHGHRVYPLTLTGLSERSHLLNAGVSLETHIQEVVSMLVSLLQPIRSPATSRGSGAGTTCTRQGGTASRRGRYGSPFLHQVGSDAYVPLGVEVAGGTGRGAGLRGSSARRRVTVSQSSNAVLGRRGIRWPMWIRGG
jgi:hypothetical protein